MRINYPPIKPIGSEQPPALADIVAHTNDVFRDPYPHGIRPYKDAGWQKFYPEDIVHDAYGSDVMTIAHETCHGVNNDIANGPGGGRSKSVGLYALNDVAFHIEEPPITIQDVARVVPKEYRGGICQVYDLYLVKQAASWGDRPLYLADEWYAYTAGATVALEAARAGDKDPNRWSEIQNAIYFNAFLCVEWSVLGAKGAQNPEIKEMIAFNLDRVEEVYLNSQEFSQLTRSETTELLMQFYESEWYKPFKGGGGLADLGSDSYL